MTSLDSPGISTGAVPARTTAVLTTRQARVLPDYFEQTADLRQDAVAVVCGSAELGYRELDREANRLARLLRDRGVRPGDTVGILLPRSLHTYVAVLGVLKSGAAYVPIDPSFPEDRLAYMVSDAGLSDLVTTSESRERTRALDCPVLELDLAGEELAAHSGDRPGIAIDPESPCYVIYTSGSTGKPKGVVISHASIANFLRVATPIYGVTASDRVYQGMSISFDFHLEEMWPAWVAGATLIAGPNDARRFGNGLTDFLTEHGVTVLCSVPTLLTTVEDDPPSVRCLLVSGEAMPPDLVRRWSRPGRRILNCYGPTETTVSSSCTELLPNRPVTLGTPFPTYRFYVLDEDLCEVADGEAGEICIGGPGVGIGYLNRAELTAERFIPNPVARDRAEVPRVYRTGDLGTRTPDGEYEFLGRMDTQVKIRGYRIELGEIEQVIRDDSAVENAVVTMLDRDGVPDLVAYLTLRPHNGSDPGHARLRGRLHTTLRQRLPPYMIPSFVEVLDRFPLLAADKVDRSALPPPTSRPLGSVAGAHVPPEGPLETELAEACARILDQPEVSVEADFFCDLGGHSLTAARLVSRLRALPAMRGLAMEDVYAHPTLRGLAKYVETELAAASSTTDRTATGTPEPIRHSSLRVWACGLAQFVLLYGWLGLMSAPTLALLFFALDKVGAGLAPGTGATAAMDSLDLATVIPIWAGWFLVTTFALPVLGCRLVLAGVRPGWYPLWGLTYLRFWFHARIAALAPLPVLAGTPLMTPYLRLMGAKIGKRCQLATPMIGLPKFVEIGDDVSIGDRARIETYLVDGGRLRLAPVRIGDGAHVGTNTAVLAGADIGANASVGHQSLVHADLRVPSDEHWAGVPLRRLPAMPALLATMAERADTRPWRASIIAGYLAGSLLLLLLPTMLLIPSGAVLVIALNDGGIGFVVASAVLAGPLLVLVACALLIVGKRAVLPRVRPGLYSDRGAFGLRLWLSNRLLDQIVLQIRTVFCTLYAIPVLRALGLRMGKWCEVAVPTHLNVDLARFGDQCFLAAGVVIAPGVYHRGQVALNPAELGNRGFVGNVALVPGGAKMGDNSLLGVMSVPPEKPMDPETTWLGSPSFFLPRRQISAKFPEKLTYAPTPGLVASRLFLELFRVFMPSMLTALGTFAGLYAMAQLLAHVPLLAVAALLPAITLAVGLANTLVTAALKWLVMGRYRPRTEPYWGTWVRGTELITGLYEAVAVPQLVGNFTGTPWISPLVRLFGVRVGRRVWLNSVSFTEFDLVEIGDDAMIGQEADLQTHLFEDRVMKMSYSKAGASASVGSHAVVLYDAEASAGSFLDADSLVMKGETLPDASGWRGIPARPL
ncbi:Pls/PosA family non-ribosomal peptide synthetase [Amycolatopsis minnesotensis]|uniref:Non-ribosomal peptide synthetase n=1 Tax=Amycolatopsis minnesotensis TaxID=337894 RepID=A0ABP5CN96_9PSEU